MARQINEFEELSIDGEQFDEIVRLGNAERFSFPALTIPDGNNHGVIYFNSSASAMIGDARYAKIKLSPQYVVFELFKDRENNSFKLVGKGCMTVGLTFPVELKNRVAKGYYKCYRCKNGVAIKRYEPIKAE